MASSGKMQDLAGHGWHGSMGAILDQGCLAWFMQAGGGYTNLGLVRESCFD